MSVTTFNADAHIRELRECRNAWLEVLTKNPDHIEAAYHVLTCNEKLNLLRMLRGGPVAPQD